MVKPPVLVLYVPVLHQGYIELFERCRHRGVERIVLPGQELIRELTFLEPEIRAIDPSTMTGLIGSLGYFKRVSLLNGAGDWSWLIGLELILTVNEGLSQRLIAKYWPEHTVEYDTAFLRWDETNVFSQAPAGYDRISDDAFDKKMMTEAQAQTREVGDWWRQIGGVLVHGWQVLLTGSNRHVPSQQTPYVNGDPRDFIAAGVQPEIATALHCEQYLIAEAARQGRSLNGAWLYVTVFPCPVCARLIAAAGIERVYFRTGHATLDGQTVLQAHGVELVLVP